jgi:hypothetical protein
MNDRIAQNPYKILGVSRLASNAEITKAFSVAMKERKYPPDEIAKARKSLMNPDERILADYLSPAIPPIKRFRSSITDREVHSEERLNPAQVDRTRKSRCSMRSSISKFSLGVIINARSIASRLFIN